MRRRILGTLLWCGVLLAVGTIRCLLVLLRAVCVRPKWVLVLVGLAVVLSSASALSASVSVAAVRLLEHGIVAWGSVVLSAIVLIQGCRSREVRTLRRWLRRRGWAL